MRKSKKLIEAKMPDPQEIQNALINSKVINDIHALFSDLSETINQLEQHVKKSFTEHRTAIVNEVLDLINRSSLEMITVRNLMFASGPGQGGMILIDDEINKIPNCLYQNENIITNNIFQLLYDKGLFDSFINNDHLLANYLTLSEAYLLVRYGQTILSSDGEYYKSYLEYSTREIKLKALKNDSNIVIIDMKHRMKLTSLEKKSFYMNKLCLI